MTPYYDETPEQMGGDEMNPQSLNRYAYADNNPTTLTDPSGLQPFDGSCDPLDPEGCLPECSYMNPSGCPPGCDPLDPETCPLYLCYELGICYHYNGSGSSSGGGAPAPPSVPPAGQPPLAGGTGFEPGVSTIEQTIPTWPTAIQVLVEACGLNPVACGAIVGIGVVGVAGYEGYRLYEQLKPQPKVVPVATPTAKPVLQNSGKQAKCTGARIDWGLGLCTYESCEDGLPWAEPIPAGNQCPNTVYKDWGR